MHLLDGVPCLRMYKCINYTLFFIWLVLSICICVSGGIGGEFGLGWDWKDTLG